MFQKCAEILWESKVDRSLKKVHEISRKLEGADLHASKSSSTASAGLKSTSNMMLLYHGGMVWYGMVWYGMVWEP